MDAAKIEARVYVIDNFHPYPVGLRAHAIEQEFGDVSGMEAGVIYRRVCLIKVPLLREMLEGIFGPIEVHLMGYRLNYIGENPNQPIHSDVGYGTYALVLYLSEGPSGTAFWKHKVTGTKSLPPHNEELLEIVNKDWADESKWEMQRFVPMKFNRAVIYESEIFHSRYPFEAYGHDPETGRLIAVAFFTPKDKS